ncbi:phosphotransferase family protein [Agromyces albus]|uniref:Aminoglycoside phosphotransferase family protein n=1 Tax=Agromyces albus TaxID=205332 RepID=A0A4Q2L351_9MICO|nr:aminoglycoside phosphotransferase family protein [Agromyces albus]RXZ72558.1 aminoglycoside phosphotransferase family protein [Agromyces albus]
MESVTKNRQSSQVLSAMVARAYGPESVPAGDSWYSELGDGWFNIAYRITLRDGRDVVLKVAPPADVEVMTYERDAMRTELKTIELLRQLGDIPVPRVDYADVSREVCDADYFFMEHIDAENLAARMSELPPDEVRSHMVELGAMNRRINTIVGPAFGSITGPDHSTWDSAFLQMVDELLADGERRSVDLGATSDSIRQLIIGNIDSLREVTVPRLVEWDLWPGNVLISGGRIRAVIDHERAFFGDPLIEVGFAGTQSAHFGDSDAFMEGYGHPELSTTEVTRRKLYQIHLCLILTIETAYREYGDPNHYEWARRQLAESLAAL